MTATEMTDEEKRLRVAMMRVLLTISGMVGATASLQAQDGAAAYLGQSPPGSEPGIFAPGIVSQPDVYEYGSVWSADGLELYYAVNVGSRAEIRSTQWTDGAWSPASVVVGDDRYTFGDPFLSNDERRLFFISDRPLTQNDDPPKDFDIWFVERHAEAALEAAGAPWGTPINLGTSVNSPADEYYISFSDEGRLYFASNVNAGDRRRNFDLYAAEVTSSGFEAPLRLRGEVNTPGYEADAFVAPDESYIIFASDREEGLGQGDLYISFKGEDGLWGAGIHLGDKINTEGHELCPFVTADGRFLFYTSAEDIYWVDSEILDQFRP